jgi:hypothetical protein
MNTKLIPLIRASQDHYTAACSDPVTKTAVLANALPVAWFGNSDEYFNSECKVVTVGLNPKSGMNPAWHNVGAKTVSDHQLGALYDDYFEGKLVVPSIGYKQWNQTYLKWFKSIDTKVRKISAAMTGNREINASYNGKLIAPKKAKMPNTMLHLDLYSTAPTNSVWSAVNDAVRLQFIAQLAPNGIDLFKQALAALNPDVVIFGIGVSSDGAKPRGQVLRDVFKVDPSKWPHAVGGATASPVAALQQVDLNAYCCQTGLNKNTAFLWLQSRRTPLSSCPPEAAACLLDRHFAKSAPIVLSPNHTI